MNHNMEMTEKTTGSGSARWGFYLMGLLILAMGLTLNTKAGLGVSPIISLSYAASVIWNRNFGDMTFVLYGIFVLIQAAIHLREKGKAGRSLLMKDALQFPLSIVFTRFLNLFSAMVPDIQAEGKNAAVLFEIRLLVLALALILTGIGAALSLNMRIVPNPGDGIVQAIADCIHKSIGFTKNCVDVTCVTITVIISLVGSGKLHGIGIGTIIAMVVVGRIIAVFNHFTKEKLIKLTGVEE